MKLFIPIKKAVLGIIAEVTFAACLFLTAFLFSFLIAYFQR